MLSLFGSLGADIVNFGSGEAHDSVLFYGEEFRNEGDGRPSGIDGYEATFNGLRLIILSNLFLLSLHLMASITRLFLKLSLTLMLLD